MTDRIAEPWGPRAPFARGGAWPERVDRHLVEGMAEEDVDRWVESACPLCSNGCGMDVAVKDGRMVGVRGRGEDRVSRGRLGPKGLFGWQANHSGDRLTRPLVRRDGELRPVDWDAAMDLIVERTNGLLAERGPSALGFYTSGQLFLEEYYTLATIVRGGLGCPHLDANTRLCTATAESALKASFACDGQPGSYVDVDHADTLFLVGHNAAETHTVLWMRILDRLRGPDRPRLVVVDPRPTAAAREADVHLAIRSGTNLPLLNAVLHEVLDHGWVDSGFVAEHTVGFDGLAAAVRDWPPERAAEVCGVPAAAIRAAARALGTAPRLVSTVLQGVYQSHQATAAACQVNNLHLVRGMIGRPGATVFQMNGQPTAQNTRETGASGELPGFRNWQNAAHVEEVAKLWNVDAATLPGADDRTHVMQMLRCVEDGSIGLLWVSCTNPAVSLPELRRIRATLDGESLFLVVQDAFPTETAELADVVLPAAIWGEKTGTFTNTDRTVHLSERAVEPPGEARPDLDIFLDFARRLALRDRSGAPLPGWEDAESAFEAWTACSRGRPCDQSGLSYAKLRGSGGIQWPCTADAPAGTERLYADGRFFSDPDECQDFGKDLLTGAPYGEADYRALNPAGRAIIRVAPVVEPPEAPDEDYPLRLTTGRTVYQFHTRTKTGRAPQLDDAAPEPWVEISPADAVALALAEGDLAEVASARGAVRARVRVAGVREGVVSMPFHYAAGSGTAANELTITHWDPVSKQPAFKVGAVRVRKVADGGGRTSLAPATGASAPVSAGAARGRAGSSPR